MRVLVCGGRDYSNWRKVCDTLRAIHDDTQITRIIHGHAQGADRIASNWARLAGISQTVFEPKWREYGKAAGPMRNQEMLDTGQPQLVVAFPGGRGTADMVERAEGAGVRVMRIEP
jgi:hypothetical protein